MIQGAFGADSGLLKALARFWAEANSRPSHAAAPESLAPRSVLKKIGERGRRAGLAARRSHRRRRPRRQRPRRRQATMSSFGLNKRLDEILELSNPRVFPETRTLLFIQILVNWLRGESFDYKSL